MKHTKQSRLPHWVESAVDGVIAVALNPVGLVVRWLASRVRQLTVKLVERVALDPRGVTLTVGFYALVAGLLVSILTVVSR